MCNLNNNNTSMKGGRSRGLGSERRSSVPDTLDGLLAVPEVMEYKLIGCYIDTLEFVVKCAISNYDSCILPDDLLTALVKVKNDIFLLRQHYSNCLQFTIKSNRVPEVF